MLKSDSEIKRGKRTSELWNYFTLIDHKFASCNLCGSRMVHATSSSNLKKHLVRKHKEYYPNSQKRIPIQEEQEYEHVEYVNEENLEEDSEEVEEVVVQERNSFVKHSNIFNKPKTPVVITKKLKTKPNNNNHMIQEAITILSSVAQTSHAPDNEEEDEFLQFGKYVTTQLRQLPLVNALDIQEQFYSILTRERINILKNANEGQAYGVKLRTQPKHYVQNQNKFEHQYSQQQKQIDMQTKNMHVQQQVEIETSSPSESMIESVVDNFTEQD